jgi:branched-chain amino acid transport system permease protein
VPQCDSDDAVCPQKSYDPRYAVRYSAVILSAFFLRHNECGEVALVDLVKVFFGAGLAEFAQEQAVCQPRLVRPRGSNRAQIPSLPYVSDMLDALPQNQLLLTIGLGLIMSNAMMLAFTSDYKILTTSYSSASVTLAGISISEPLAISFLITAGITALLYWFLTRTDTGQAIRATAQDAQAAQLMGINVKRMGMIAFGIGGALAATAGALISPTYYIYPQVGGAFTLKAFVITVMGGMGSVVGATIGGIIIGVTESVSSVCISSGWKDVVVFAVFLLVLLFKPAGLMGKSRM